MAKKFSHQVGQKNNIDIELSEFRNSFSEAQKVAVMHCLLIAEEIGINADQYRSILDKMAALYKLFIK